MEIEEAIENGKIRAEEILKIRKQAKFKRAAALRKLQSTTRKGRRHFPSASSAVSAVASSAGTLIGEGDSWFDYPFSDILKILEDDYAYDVESVAHHGDLIEDIAYTGMPVGYKPIEISGQVIKQLTGKASKSEHQATFLVTKAGTYRLRRSGGNPFVDPELDKLVGKTIHCTGILTENTLIISSWDAD